jgi:hypothetical protein
VNILRLGLAFVGATLGLLVLAPLGLLMLPLWLVGAATKALARRREPRAVSWPAIVEYEATMGWRPKANVDVHLLGDEAVHVTTDAEGWRGRHGVAESDVVVFGDSYAFGHAADDAWYFANLDGPVRIKAIGVHGYSMVQELLWMRRMAPRLANKLVVWFVFLGNDLIDNLEPSLVAHRAPFLRAAGDDTSWEVATEHVSPAPWPFVPARYARANYDRLTRYFTSPGFAARAASACRWLLAEGQTTCREADAELAVVTIPDVLLLSDRGFRLLFDHGVDAATFDPDLPDKDLRSACEELKIPFLPGRSFLRREHYLVHDDHWNEAGHRVVAEQIAQLYRARRSGMTSVVS